MVDVIGRFLNMGVEAYNFVSALNCILAQRLVRTICEYCDQPVQLRREFLAPAAWIRRVERTSNSTKAGCIECGGTGYPRTNRDPRVT